MSGGAFDQVQTPETFALQAVEGDIPLAERPDVLVFRSEPLSDALTIAGPVVAELWVSTDCPDTDFTMKLIDEYPETPELPGGYAMNLTDGIFRLRFRDGWDREVFASAGDAYAIRIEAFDTCNSFGKGHRIRVDISSSNYPHYDVNPNTGEPMGRHTHTVKANNAVFMDPQHPSSITLPVID